MKGVLEKHRRADASRGCVVNGRSPGSIRRRLAVIVKRIFFYGKIQLTKS